MSRPTFSSKAHVARFIAVIAALVGLGALLYFDALIVAYIIAGVVGTGILAWVIGVVLIVTDDIT